MAALDLHHALFADEKDSDLFLCRAASFLRAAPERDANPTSHLLSSLAYQDLIQRQPTHPDGPASGWDLGLNLFGDPITVAEHKSLEDHQTKMKLRRLRAINVAFELLFGAWGTYTIVRYLLASTSGLGGTEHVCVLVLGAVSALAVALVVISILMPLFPRRGHLRAWRYTKLCLRACYVLLLSAGAVVNLVLVSLWHPTQLCSWDVDILWHTSARNTVASPCRTTSFAAWMAAAIVRLVVMLITALSFSYTVYSYHRTRHPCSEGKSATYSTCLSAGSAAVSPDSTSAPLHFLKSTFRFTRSEDSNHTLNQSNATLPRYNSISSFSPSTSCTGQSRSHSTPPLKDGSLPRISPPASRRTSIYATSHGSSLTQVGFEAPQTPSVVAASWTPHMLRRTNRISVAGATPDTKWSHIPTHSPVIARDPPEIRSHASWKPGHRGGGVHHLDIEKTTWVSESVHDGHASPASGSPEASPTHDDGESVEEKVEGDAVLVYSYGYGASGPAYPYLDMYNPQRPEGYAEMLPLCEDADEHGVSEGHGRAVSSVSGSYEVSSEPGSPPCRGGGENSREEEEYVAMMGRFVRRMATIESLGSKEAVGTLSTTTGSVALHSTRSGAPASQFSSVRFADLGSSCGSLGMSASGEGSLSTAYLSFSSGGAGMPVNERGELVHVGHDVNRGTAHWSFDCHDYTASGSSLSRTDDGDR